MLIFCEQINPRVSYSFEYVFIQRLGLSFDITNNENEFLSATDNKINYSLKYFEGITCIHPAGLLSENRITKKSKKNLKVSYQNGIPIIFETSVECGLGFDIFSAIFYFLSRYEEYHPFEADSHDRFPAKESLAFRNIFLNQPVVDHWVILFKQFLLGRFGTLHFKKEEFEIIPTIDVDSPWCYRHKGIVRNGLGLLRDLTYLKLKLVFIRIVVLLRIKSDPWFVFNWLNAFLSENQLHPIYFIHVGRYGLYDKTVNPNRFMFKRFVQKLNANYPVALHPSYNSSTKPAIFKSEVKRLSKIVGFPVQKSRQHYLKFQLPEYYQMLIDAGITDDYSMGFADKPGFRAGTTRPFFWYNLKEEKPTQLIVHPFAAMDRTLNKYENQSVQGARLIYAELLSNVQEVDGLFVTLWHNESFSNLLEWNGWKDLFLEVMKKPVLEHDD